jgi:DNA-binding CsgD family transcriptional regulator
MLARVRAVEAHLEVITVSEAEPLGRAVDALRRALSADQAIVGVSADDAFAASAERLVGSGVRVPRKLAGLPWESVVSGLGLRGDGTLAATLTAGGAPIGWVAAFRRAGFASLERRVFERLVPALRRRIDVERRIRHFEAALAVRRASMDAIAGPAFVVDASGSIRQMNAGGAALVESDAAAVASKLHAALRPGAHDAGDVDVREVLGTDLRLVILREPSQTRSARVVAAAARWNLTSRQTDVLRLVSGGTPNKHIAATLGIAERTVESHVTSILSRAGVESRSALVARLLQEP